MEKSNSDIAMFLRRVADMLEISGENAFKARAYRTAAATVEDVQAPLSRLVDEGGAAELQKLPGIGKSLAMQIVEFAGTGTSASYERLRTEVPDSIAEVLAVRGIGMKMASTLYRDFDVVDLEDLMRFAEGGGFEAVPGLGDKTIDRLVASVRAATGARASLPLDEAERQAEAIAERVRAARPDAEVVVAGEVRRRRPRVASLDLLALTAGEREAVVEAFAAAAEPVLVADGRAEAVVDGRIRATLEVAPPDQRGVALVRATGSRRHLRQLAERAAARGVALEGETEEEVYAALGLPLIPPDEREGTGEVD